MVSTRDVYSFCCIEMLKRKKCPELVLKHYVYNASRANRYVISLFSFFFRKCRLDGDLSFDSEKGYEINYSMMDEHGGINEGIVRPADLLSFARQVAMAMVRDTV